MAVSVGGVPGSAEDGAPDPAWPPAVGRTRRDLARGLYSCALSAALASASAASGPRHPPPGSAAGDAAFDVTYRGRRLRGRWFPGCGAAEGGRWHVTVDSRPLHLMRRADGTWLSMVDHYCSYPTPLEAARAAVDELGSGQGLRALLPQPADGGHPHRDHRHGVRA
ncbi:tyrosinase family oxidase copper chaperone [Streptomyces sp. NPDC019990]|uniref:tyrosinase family oxidase copper chaperone n=1 Tax=Streptomyces sp. NPDC019990 TaxID=3154693 RepID=UPI0033DDC94D